MFTLPAMVVFYVLIFRGFLWVVGPAMLFVMPKLKGHAMFDRTVQQRTNALSFDVRTPLASWQAAWQRLCARTRMYSSWLSVAGCTWAD